MYLQYQSVLKILNCTHEKDIAAPGKETQTTNKMMLQENKYFRWILGRKVIKNNLFVLDYYSSRNC